MGGGVLDPFAGRSIAMFVASLVRLPLADRAPSAMCIAISANNEGDQPSATILSCEMPPRAKAKLTPEQEVARLREVAQAKHYKNNFNNIVTALKANMHACPSAWDAIIQVIEREGHMPGGMASAGAAGGSGGQASSSGSGAQGSQGARGSAGAPPGTGSNFTTPKKGGVEKDDASPLPNAIAAS